MHQGFLHFSLLELNGLRRNILTLYQGSNLNAAIFLKY